MGVAVALAVAGVGLLAGVRGTGREVSSQRYARRAAEVVAAGDARSYADLRRRMTGPNAALPARWWEGLPTGDVLAPVVQTAAEREQALARRASRRAYDGAPPTVPHAIDQLDVPACLRCHERGARIATLVAPRMSHAVMSSCVQCHVVSEDPRATDPGAPASAIAATGPALPPLVVADSAFVGLPAPRGGERAWPGAPPTIPHTTWMRERCDSCHGVWGAQGVKSTHPWRASCTQCHAPAAALDQRPVWTPASAASGALSAAVPEALGPPGASASAGGR